MTRKLVGAVVGIVLAMLVVALVQTVGHYLFPEPELPANPSPQQLRDAVAAAPVGAKAMVVLSWFLGALVGVWAALRISNGARRSALVVAGAVLLLTIAVLLSVTHPTWMVALGLLVPVLATFLATRIVPFAEA
ncbi:hypothetical protein [Hyphomonas jannaschiana]|jgi:hypothetical protein|uniref:Uncharacterized protein n=1 Tax=Hyphomonas jannaschiana VP2 TaxID=1280952 RepID=A0A059FLB0_9PROT|nr:hypothetical protein [Hyphomonas jannaschiana]KCZ91424.1 hypothetical protein HJA_02760 [Hyphomonas jannaschiana VP2]MCA8892013.1 hypothetical protein [Hyphomonas sp.]